MRLLDAGTKTFRLLALFFAALVLLLFSSSALTQDSPVIRGLAVARQVAEAERGAPLSLLRWLYYEDNWANEASRLRYGAFGIDNCTASVPFPQKRSILFGWTYSLTDASGKEYQVRVSYDLADTQVCDEVLVPPQFAQPATPPPAPAPAPEAAPEAAAAPADPGPAPGPAPSSTAQTGGFALGGHVAGFDGTAAGLMKRAGMTWVKKQVIHGINDGAGIIPAAHGQDFKVLLGAKGNKGALANDFNGYVAQFAEYVAHLARQGADAIEVWNEPNIDQEWPTGQIDGAKYTRMLAEAYRAIKAVNPATIVISGAPAPTGAENAFPGRVVNDDRFMQQMAAAGAAQYMDCLGLHYNEGVISPTQSGGDPRGGYPTYFFQSMLNRGAQFFPNTKVCWTELGYLSGEGMPGPLPANFAWASHVTLGQQAEWLGQAAQLSRSSGRVLIMIVWNVNFTVWGNDPQAGYAMLRPGGGCPACDSLGQVMRG